MVTDLCYDSKDQSNAISVIEAVTGLLHQHINTSIRVQTKHTASPDSTTAARQCFGGVGMFTGATRAAAAAAASSNADSNRDTLMCNLLKLLNALVHIPLPQQHQPRATTEESSTEPAATGGTGGSSMTDSSKISQQGGITQPPSAVSEEQQTDEQKTETAAAQAAAAAAASPSTSAAAAAGASGARSNNSRLSRACMHYPDSRHPEQAVKAVALADNILARPHIMAQLLQALSHCTSTSTVAMLLAVSASGGHASADSLHDPATMDPQSMGDAVFQLLCSLNRKASDVKLIVKAVYTYIKSGFQGYLQAGISKLSEPLLWFILRVLDCDRAITLFLDMGKVFFNSPMRPNAFE